MRIFISYAREDHDLAQKVCRIATKAGHVVWLDNRSLPTGASWENLIRDAIQKTDVVVVLVTRALSARPQSYVQQELQIAGEFWQTRPADQTWIIPLVFDGAAVPAWPIWNAATLATLNGRPVPGIGKERALKDFFHGFAKNDLRHDQAFAALSGFRGGQWENISKDYWIQFYVFPDWKTNFRCLWKPPGKWFSMESLVEARGTLLMNPERCLLRLKTFGVGQGQIGSNIILTEVRESTVNATLEIRGRRRVEKFSRAQSTLSMGLHYNPSEY